MKEIQLLRSGECESVSENEMVAKINEIAKVVNDLIQLQVEMPLSNSWMKVAVRLFGREVVKQLTALTKDMGAK
jgi:hypothetical protein